METTNAERFDRMLKLTTSLLFEKERSFFRCDETSRKPKRLVEIGSGNGYYLSQLVKDRPNATATGLEMSEALYPYTLPYVHDRLQFIQTTYESYQPEAPFDTVLCRLVIDHLASRSHLYQWIRRHTTPQASLWIIDIEDIACHAFDALPAYSALFVRERRRIRPGGLFSLKQRLRAELMEVGFVEEEQMSYDLTHHHPDQKQQLYTYLRLSAQLMHDNQAQLDKIEQELQEWLTDVHSTLSIPMFAMQWRRRN
ncbi:class I SAM-dependent methyltransferase [Marinicrinis sediminis]|uniref:Class I SAM-dependent methyltransferase n=1 Tax=Marinicrinis sediminis TaxID=1652465 RepID=A0ABW5RDM3_9BACL